MDPRTIAAPRAQASESSFISKVYLWMSLGLGLSALASMWLMSQPALLKAIFGNQWIFFGLILAELGLVIGLSAALMRMGSVMAAALFCLYSFLNGLTLTSIFFVFTAQSILLAFLVTAGTFLFFSMYGLTTKKDLTGLGSLAMMGLIGVIIASVVNFFLKSTMLMWIATYVGVGVFLALIAYDTQKLKAMHAMGFENEEMRKKLAVLGALTLYLDFVNLFLLILRIFGRHRD